MRNRLIIAALAIITASSQATQLALVEAGAPAIHCLFDTNCAPNVEDSSSPITLPGTSGSGLFQTRIINGQPGSAAEGLYAYLYRIDLTGIQTNEPCFTNIVRCATNRVAIFTTNVVLRTNVIGYSREVICDKLRIPETNAVFYFTNTRPASTFIRCATNAAGDTMCVTNFYPETNVVLRHTLRLPEVERSFCQTNIINPGSNVVTYATNRTVQYTNVIVCATNTVPCFQTASSRIDTVRLRFGRVVSSFDYDGNGTNGDQIFVITSGSLGTVKPSSIEQDDGVVTVRFNPALSPGDSSLFIGLLSSNAPRTVSAVLGLSSGAKVEAAARAPERIRPAIRCDFDPLIQAIGSLTTIDFVKGDGWTSTLRESLLTSAKAASHAAEEGDVGRVLEGLQMIINKGDRGGNGWLTPEAVSRIRPLLFDLLSCLQQFNQHSEDED